MAILMDLASHPIMDLEQHPIIGEYLLIFLRFFFYIFQSNSVSIIFLT